MLPDARRRAVGPFVFFDRFGPVFSPHEVDSDIGPQPHIGLATPTYLFEDSLMHRDSLGTVQAITPEAINWMTAGQGIVHSERGPDEARAGLAACTACSCGWRCHRNSKAPGRAFSISLRPNCPRGTADGMRLRVLVGEAFGVRSPVRMWWNFVSTEPERIAAAARRWAAGGFDVIPGETTRVAGPPWKD